MWIKICDRCGRKTKNNAAFLSPVSKEEGSLNVDNTWFGKPIVLCNNCLEDFDKFRYNHHRFNTVFDEEKL